MQNLNKGIIRDDLAASDFSQAIVLHDRSSFDDYVRNDDVETRRQTQMRGAIINRRERPLSRWPSFLFHSSYTNKIHQTNKSNVKPIAG